VSRRAAATGTTTAAPGRETDGEDGMKLSFGSLRRRCGFAGIVVAMVTLALASHQAIAAEGHACREQVARLLLNYGLDIDKMKDLQWYEDTYQTPEGTSVIDGYRVYATPDSCKAGDVVMRVLSFGCHIVDVHSRGDCRVKGMPYMWTTWQQ
jgi:hypothetical protein